MEKLENVILKVTNNCNMNCKMCGQNIREERRQSISDLRLEELIKFLDVDISGVNVCVWGGEPLLHSEISEVIAYFKAQKCKVGMITNGYYLDRFIDTLINLQLDYITVSVDGTEQIHDSIRGVKGAYNKVINNLQMLLTQIKKRNINLHNFYVNVNYTIIGDNVDCMGEFVDIIEKMGVNSITFNLPILVNRENGAKFEEVGKRIFGREFNSWRGYSDKNVDVDIDKLAAQCKQIQEIHPFVDEEHFIVGWSVGEANLFYDKLYTYFYETDKSLNCNNDICGIRNNTLVIDATGNIITCPDYPDTIVGNIRESKLSEYINVDIYKKIFDRCRRLPMCMRCCHRK